MADLEIKRGTTARIVSTVSPASLVTDSDIFFMAKRQVSDADADAVISKELGNGIEVTDEDGGEITITIEPTDTRELPNLETRLIYEIEIEKDGERYKPDEGAITVKQETIQRIIV